MAKVVIVMDGGLVQDILTDEPIEVMVLDYDVEGADEDELTPIPQDNGGEEDASVSIREAEVNPERVAELYDLCTEEVTEQEG